LSEIKVFFNKIICGNCVDIMSGFPDDSIDLVVTSPPYDSLRSYQGYDFDYKLVADQLFRVIKPGGIVVWVIGDATVNGSETLTSFKHALYFKAIGFRVHDTMIWNKPNFSNPSSNRYHQIFEYMFVFSKGKPKTFNPIKDKVNKYSECFGRNTSRLPSGEMVERSKNTIGSMGMRHNVWVMNTAGQENVCKSLPHPAMFPDVLARDHIISWSNRGDLVLDPMCGSGTVAKCCKMLNRDYIGIDISEEYCKLAEESLSLVV
jgi:site-specific DNA-methyltransferase (adenine-specific)